jgi:hypothetical protein
MDRKISLGLTLIAGGALLATSANAQNTYLINFPVADVIKNHEVELNFRVYGYAQNFSRGFNYQATATVGLFDRAQVGIANDLRGHTTYNGAFKVYESEEGKYAVTIGANHYDPNANLTDSYIAFRKDFPAFKFHAAAYKADTVTGVFGVDFPTGNGFTAAAEYNSGPNSEIWFAAKSPIFFHGFSATVATRFPWDGGMTPQYQAILNYSRRF